MCFGHVFTSSPILLPTWGLFDVRCKLPTCQEHVIGTCVQD